MTGRLLITGGNGQLGWDLARAGTVAGWSVTSLDRASLDITDRSEVQSAVRAVRPDVVVNCAAWTAVDACEAEPDRAMAVNGTAVLNLVDAVDSAGAHLLQISTDYVFSGVHDDPVGEWRESDVAHPQTAYGRSKLAGERAATDHTVVRTSWLSGRHGPNIVKTILRLGAQGGELRFVDDQRGKPTFTADLSLILLRLADARPGGVFHATNARPVSWFDFAQEVMAAGGFDPSRVHPIPTSAQEPPRPAVRPTNSALANEALIAADLGPPMRDFAEPLVELIHEITGG